MRSSHYFLRTNDSAWNRNLKVFDTFVMFVRQNRDLIRAQQVPCYCANDKVKSLGWYLLVSAKDTDDAFRALYSYILSEEESILRLRLVFNQDIMFYAQKDYALREAMQFAVTEFPQTKLFIKQSMAPLQIFKDILLHLYEHEKAEASLRKSLRK